MTQTGTVQKVESKKSKTGNEYCLATIDGKKYGCWDFKLFSYLKEGSQVAFDFEVNGEFKNITSIIPSSQNFNSTVGPANVQSRDDAKSESMARFNALNNSSQMMMVLKDLGQFEGRSPKDILIVQKTLVDAYLKFLTKGEPLIEADPGKMVEVMQELFK